MSPGPPCIHDPERAHGVLVREGGLDSEAHRVDVNDPVYLERIEMANDLCLGSSATFGASRGCRRGTCRPTSTGTSTSLGSTRPGTDGTGPKGWCAIS